MRAHATEVARGDRFAFGANWARFLSEVNEERIVEAEKSLREMLGASDLKGKRFLDVGSGSGLFSLAARRMGAVVHSFDYDPESVACTLELKRRYFAGDSHWLIEEGSVLDCDYLARLGQYDFVYSWGVLHHTGAMWDALENIRSLVRPDGRLFIAIYNDQGPSSVRWRRVKKTYCSMRGPGKLLILGFALARLWGPTTVRDLLSGHPGRTWRNYGKAQGGRGMSAWRDVVDWVGGYPFEVATPEQICEFYSGAGFVLVRLKSAAGGLGCNEYVFARGA